MHSPAEGPYWSSLAGVLACAVAADENGHSGVLLLVAVALTDKEAVLFLTRLAALDNVMLAVGPSREQWQKTFLDLLYTMCTKVVPPHVSFFLLL